MDLFFNSSQDKAAQKAAWTEWNQTNSFLTTTLRQTAKQAYTAGKITEEQQHMFYMSGR